MPDNGIVNEVLAAGSSFTIPEGYHAGYGKVVAMSLEEQGRHDVHAGHSGQDNHTGGLLHYGKLGVEREQQPYGGEYSLRRDHF